MNAPPDFRRALGTVRTNRILVDVRQPTVLDNDPAASDRRPDTGEAEPEQQVTVKGVGIERCKRYVVGNDDVSQLSRRERSARFPEYAVADAAVVFQQDVAGFRESDRRVAMVGSLVPVHGARL